MCCRRSTRGSPIYLNAPGALSGHVKVENGRLWMAVISTDVCRRSWWSMRDIMPARSDDSPVSRDLREVSHLKAGGR